MLSKARRSILELYQHRSESTQYRPSLLRVRGYSIVAGISDRVRTSGSAVWTEARLGGLRRLWFRLYLHIHECVDVKDWVQDFEQKLIPTPARDVKRACKGLGGLSVRSEKRRKT